MSQAVTGQAIHFHEPAMTWDIKTVCLYGVPLAGAITAMVIGILALLQAHGVLDCGAWIGSISTRGAITDISISAVTIILMLSLKPIIVAIVKRSTQFADVSDYPKNAPPNTYTPYDANTYCVTDGNGRQTTHRFVGSADRSAFKKQLEDGGITQTPLIALKSDATFKAHSKDPAESLYLELIVNQYRKGDSWCSAFEEFSVKRSAFAYYGVNSYELGPQEQPDRAAYHHFILQIAENGARGIHMFASLAVAREYAHNFLDGYSIVRDFPA